MARSDSNGPEPRVLRLTPAYDWRSLAGSDATGAAVGGLAVQVQRLTAGTAQLGIEQTVLAPGPDGAPKSAAPSPGVKIVAAGRSTGGVHRRNMAWLGHVVRFLARHGRGYEVVHVHASGLLEPLLAAIAARLVTRRPLVLTLHCSARVTYVPRSRRDAMVQVFTRLAERAAVALAGRTFVLTERTRASLGGSRIEVMPDCVPAGFAARTRPAARSGHPQALFLARISPEKGWRDVIELARRLHDRRLHVRAVGGGPDVAAFRAAVAAAGLHDRVAIDGQLGPERIPEALAAADVVVLPSQHEELGSALIEAMAAGVPSVAYAVGGVPEAIHDGVTGLLVAPSDVAGLADAVARVLDDESLRESVRREGPRMAAQRHSVARASARLACAYGSRRAQRVTVMVDHYPALTETFVVNEIEALARIGHDVHVETAAWASRRGDVRGAVPVDCLDDDGRLRRVRDLAWLVARHPRGVLRDVREQRRWRVEEEVRPLRVLAPVVRRVARRRTQHLHVQFAAGAALDAMRIGALLGVTYSVTAHAYEIYRAPRNLAEKLRRAAFAAGVSDYSQADLRTIAGPAHAHRIHVVAMGVDHERFRRSKPYPGGRSVVAVGRLVEKKGFRHLLEAAALLRDEAPLERVLIIGDGPLREDLEALAAQLALDGVVEFAGAQPPERVRDALESADALVMSAVQAADGDRDVLPVVVGEALAMEVPVIASDFVALPEIVREPWGIVVPPGDARALADALARLLAEPARKRAERGQAGRAFVVAERDLDSWARRLADLIAAAKT